MSEQNKALVSRYLAEVWGKHQIAVVDELVAENFIQHNQGVPPGRNGVKMFFGMLWTAFPDVQTTVDDLVAEGDQVVWRQTIWGTQTGPFQRIPATGKSVKITSINIVRIVNGQIAENWGEVDNLGLLQQLGVIPTPGQPG